MSFFELIFSGFWTFTGFAILLFLLFDFLQKITTLIIFKSFKVSTGITDEEEEIKRLEQLKSKMMIGPDGMSEELKSLCRKIARERNFFKAALDRKETENSCDR